MEILAIVLVATSWRAASGCDVLGEIQKVLDNFEIFVQPDAVPGKELDNRGLLGELEVFVRDIWRNDQAEPLQSYVAQDLGSRAFA